MLMAAWAAAEWAGWICRRTDAGSAFNPWTGVDGTPDPDHEAKAGGAGDPARAEYPVKGEEQRNEPEIEARQLAGALAGSARRRGIVCGRHDRLLKVGCAQPLGSVAADSGDGCWRAQGGMVARCY